MGFSIDEHRVRGDVFNANGKWKYTVCLDYTNEKADYEHWDMWTIAAHALRRATKQHISGVSFEEIPEGWTMIVLEPYSKFSHPITVKG